MARFKTLSPTCRKDASVSTPGRIVHWDVSYGQYPHPILNWVDQQNGIAGFVHMQYLDNGIPQSLNYCISIEYPVEVTDFNSVGRIRLVIAPCSGGRGR